MRTKEYACTAHIKQRFKVRASSEAEAQLIVFEAIADEIAQGLIPTDAFEPADCDTFPWLDKVEMREEGEAK